MIFYLKAIVLLGLIAFPIIMKFFKGYVNYAFYWGVVFGIHYDKVYYQIRREDGTKSNFKLNMLQFHFFCVTILMNFSTSANNIELEEDI